MDSFWTDERTDDLRERFDEGQSVRAIGAAYGLSPGAVVGKLHRLGLRRGRDIARPDAKRARKPRGPYKRAPWALPVEAHRQANTEPAHAPAPDARFRCTVLDLTNETCRWPVTDDSPFAFCGTPAADLSSGAPYCPHHMRIAHA